MFKVNLDTVIGIDESNHGRFPEIYAAVASKDISDGVVEAEPIFQKHRRDGYFALLESMLSDSDISYRFLMVNRREIEAYTQSTLKTNVFVCLLSSFDINPESIKKAFIDGHGNGNTKKSVSAILQRDCGIQLPRNKIEFVREGDRKIQVVNYADMLAYHLYKNRDNSKRLK